MEFHQLKCSNCGAVLDVEDGLDTFYCKYCGSKVIVSGQDPAAIHAKAEIKKAQLDNEYREQELFYKDRQRARNDQITKMIFIGFFVFIVLCLIVLCID